MYDKKRREWYTVEIKLHLTHDESIIVEALIDKEMDDWLLRSVRKLFISVVRLLAYGLRLYNENHLDNWH